MSSNWFCDMPYGRTAKPGDNLGFTRIHNGKREVRSLKCEFCDYAVNVLALHKPGDRSGLARYNRARGKMVKHLYAEHDAIIRKVLADETARRNK